MTEHELPGDDQVGEVREWRLPAKTSTAAGGHARERTSDGHVALRGRLLGLGESQVDWRPRWLEVRIFEDLDADEYVVHTAGMSRLPGEVPLTRVERSKTADGVIERLLKREEGKETYLSIPARRALEQAALEDEDLREAWAEHRAAYLAAS